MYNIAKRLSCLVMMVASSVVLAGPRPVDWKLTPEFKSKILIQNGAEAYSVVVDPLDCVQFSRGKIVNLNYEVDGKAYTLNAKNTDWAEQVGTMACTVPLTFGTNLSVLWLPNEKEAEARNPTFVETERPGLKVHPFPSYSKLRDRELKTPMMTKFLEDGVETKVYYHIFTCLSPHYGGTVLVEKSGKMERYSLPEAREDDRVADLISISCLGHVMPYRALEKMDVEDKARVYDVINQISTKMKGLGS